jgi:hypothetical protein
MEEVYIKIYRDYEVSNYGNIKRKNKQLYGYVANNGYIVISVRENGKNKHITLHSLVAKAFLGERPEGYVIDHIDRIKLNNNVSNLRYCSVSENVKNSSIYRSDVLETDPTLRQKIFITEYKRRLGQKPRANGCIMERNGKFRAQKCVDNIKYTKTFATKEEAELYLQTFNQ